MIPSTSAHFQPATVNPAQLEMPTLLSKEALIAAIHEAFPVQPSHVDDSARTPGMVSDESVSSQNPSFPQCSPRSDGYLSLQHDSHIDPGPPHSPITFVSSTLSSSADTRVSVKAPCAGGEPIKHIGGYHCSICNESFARRDIAQRHIDYTGAKVRCRYCGKLGSDRHSNKARHLLDNKKCKKLWKVGYEAGRFTERSVEDAYRYG